MIEGIGYKRTLFQSVVIRTEGDVRHSLQRNTQETASCNLKNKTLKYISTILRAPTIMGKEMSPYIVKKCLYI